MNITIRVDRPEGEEGYDRVGYTVLDGNDKVIAAGNVSGKDNTKNIKKMLASHIKELEANMGSERCKKDMSSYTSEMDEGGKVKINWEHAPLDLEEKRDKIFDLISRNRKKQIDKGYTEDHDEQHTTLEWLAILAHETGCLSDIILNKDKVSYIFALEKVAAVCVAALEQELNDVGMWDINWDE